MKKIIVLVLILIVSISIKAQSIKDSITIELTELSNNSNLVGFGVAIINKDSIGYAKGYGYADKETKKAYTTNTQHPLLRFQKHCSLLP